MVLMMLMVACNNSEEKSTASSRPNIILFLVDDMGWQDTSVPFWKEKTRWNERYRTPNMERLAASGVKFTQAYATAVCSPTRVSLLTGMNAARHRVTNWTLQRDKLQPMESEHKFLRFPLWNVNGMAADDTTPHAVHATPFPELLQEVGYQTIHVGKAHFGAIGTPGEDPLNLGFDVNIAGHAAGAPKSYYGADNFGNVPEFEGTAWPVPDLEAYYGQAINLTEVLTIEAMKEMDVAMAARKPFFLYMAHYTVHTPIMADTRFYQNYLDAGIDTIEAKYASMVESMDHSLGDLLDYVEKRDIANNTILLFISDNGGLSAHTRGDVPLHTHNTPLSSGKGSIHEGGIREPMLARWPGVTVSGSETNDYLMIEDFFPTILEMAGVEAYETRQMLDGQSFVPLLQGQRGTPDRPLYWHYPNEWGPSGPGIGAYSAIRKGDYKLIYYHASEKFELFNIAGDISEVDNLVAKESERVEALSRELGEYLRSVDAQMPSHLETGVRVLWPDEKHKI